MSTIVSNIAALSVASYINQNNDAVSKSLLRLSSGSRLAIPSDDAGGVAISGNLTARISRLSAASTVTSSVVALAQTVDGFLSTIQLQLTRLGELATEASNSAFSSADRADYQTEFATLVAQINVIASSSSFDGLSLFASSTVTLAINATGTTDNLVLSTVATATSLGISTASVSTVTAATSAITLLTTAIACITSRRAEVNADVSKFNFYTTNIGYEKTNVTASETALLSQSTILTQLGASLLAQSNSTHKNVLGLLTGSSFV